MAREIAEGYVLMTELTLKRLAAGQIDQLGVEVEKRLRSVRAEQPDLDDIQAIQHRNRRLQRLVGAQRMIHAYRLKLQKTRR